jgi:hypothetical protein
VPEPLNYRSPVKREDWINSFYVFNRLELFWNLPEKMAVLDIYNTLVFREEMNSFS